MENRIELERMGRDKHYVTELNLDNCRSTAIVGLTDEYSNLQNLSLINVGLTSLKGLPALLELRKLELSDNRISGALDYLLKTPNLTHLSLSGNKIRDFETLQCLAKLVHLRSLDLFNCEVTTEANYRFKTFQLIPQLKFLDGTDRAGNEDEDDEEEEDEESEEPSGELEDESFDEFEDEEEGIVALQDGLDDDDDDDDEPEDDLDHVEFDTDDELEDGDQHPELHGADPVDILDTDDDDDGEVDPELECDSDDIGGEDDDGEEEEDAVVQGDEQSGQPELGEEVTIDVEDDDGCCDFEDEDEYEEECPRLDDLLKESEDGLHEENADGLLDGNMDGLLEEELNDSRDPLDGASRGMKRKHKGDEGDSDGGGE